MHIRAELGALFLPSIRYLASLPTFKDQRQTTEQLGTIQNGGMGTSYAAPQDEASSTRHSHHQPYQRAVQFSRSRLLRRAQTDHFSPHCQDDACGDSDFRHQSYLCHTLQRRRNHCLWPIDASMDANIAFYHPDCSSLRKYFWHLWV